MSAIKRITKERKEQLTKHGYTVERDAEENQGGKLINAAKYLISPHAFITPEEADTHHAAYKPTGWDAEGWLKVCNKPRLERMVVAAAFLAAEVDRIEYTLEQAKAKAKENEDSK